MSIFSKIVGSGSYLPELEITNNDFKNHIFYNPNGSLIDTAPAEIIEKFVNITGIEARRYATENQCSSDLGYLAAKNAIESSGIDKESFDYIIVAHNFGDMDLNKATSRLLPSLAARIKHMLKIDNPLTVAYDILFGCPGWVQAMIQADYFIKSGDAKRILIIGTETLSRVCDPYDRDSMIYSDGAGAVILEARESETKSGIISHATRTDTIKEAFYLWSGKSNKLDAPERDTYIKMHGRKIYEYAISTVPQLVKTCIEKAGLELKDISKILIHQANEKMDEAIVKRLFRLYGERNVPSEIMPMIIKDMGNNSVATVPILFDKISKNTINGHHFNTGDIVVFASVGAGMSVNAFAYKF